MCMAATHFEILTKLEKNTDLFTNYRMNVDIYKDGRIHYPFILEKGICDQNIALDILKGQGLDAALIDAAQQIVAAG